LRNLPAIQKISHDFSKARSTHAISLEYELDPSDPPCLQIRALRNSTSRPHEKERRHGGRMSISPRCRRDLRIYERSFLLGMSSSEYSVKAY
jgi:hypothetical protein